MKHRLFIYFLLGCWLIPSSGLKSSDTLRVAYTQAPPFIIENNGLHGINVWLWEEIAAELNMEFSLTQMGFSDMLQALEQGTIDVSINPLTITSERLNRIDFTQPYFASNSTIATYRPSRFERLRNILTSIFNFNFLRAFLLLFSIIFLFGWMAWLFERKKNPEQFRPGWNGIWDGLYWSIVTMTTVGYGDKTPKSKGGKIIALLWMFSGLLFISGLTASVASNLTINEISNNPTGYISFKERPVGCIQNTTANEFLKDHFFSDINLYNSVADGLDDLNDRKIDAFLYDEPILKYRINIEDKYKNIKLLPVQFDLQLYGFGLRKGLDSQREAISRSMLEITEGKEWRIVLAEYELSDL